MPRKGYIRCDSNGGISKTKTDEVSAAVGSISLRFSDESTLQRSLKSRGRRNAVFSSASQHKPPTVTPADCAAAQTRVLSNVAPASSSALNIHIEALSHGAVLPTLSRGIAARALRRCFLFTDVSAGVIASMCVHAREMYVAAGTVLQQEGSECTGAFVALDGAFSSNGSGGTSPCMLACEESFLLGCMTCTSRVTLLHPSHVAIFPAHSFSACSARQGQLESSIINAANVAFGRRDEAPRSFRRFLPSSHAVARINGRAYHSVHDMQPRERCSLVCMLLVYGECAAESASAGRVTLRAGSVVLATLANIPSSFLAQASGNCSVRGQSGVGHAYVVVCRM